MAHKLNNPRIKPKMLKKKPCHFKYDITSRKVHTVKLVSHINYCKCCLNYLQTVCLHVHNQGLWLDLAAVSKRWHNVHANIQNKTREKTRYI